MIYILKNRIRVIEEAYDFSHEKDVTLLLIFYFI